MSKPTQIVIRDSRYSEEEEKAVVRKIDRRIIPFISLLYLLSFLDRVNIGNIPLFTQEFH